MQQLPRLHCDARLTVRMSSRVKGLKGFPSLIPAGRSPCWRGPNAHPLPAGLLEHARNSRTQRTRTWRGKRVTRISDRGCRHTYLSLSPPPSPLPSFLREQAHPPRDAPYPPSGAQPFFFLLSSSSDKKRSGWRGDGRVRGCFPPRRDVTKQARGTRRKKKFTESRDNDVGAAG